MANEDRLTELMKSIEQINTKKNDSGNTVGGLSFQPGRETNRGGAPTSDSIGRRGDEGGGKGSSTIDPFLDRPKAVYLEIDSDKYDGTAKPDRIEGNYDYKMILRLFANPQAA